MSLLTRSLGRNPRWARLIAGTLLLATAASALVWIGRASAEKGGAAVPAGVSKSVSTQVSKADAVDSTGNACTNSFDFSDMPGMLVSFRLGGNANRSVIVLFEAVWNVSARVVT